MRSFSESYRKAGVNIEAGYEGVKLMKRHIARTMVPPWSVTSAASAACLLPSWRA
jgi:phosphoribosylaminoimidazole (AIR) synthetase